MLNKNESGVFLEEKKRRNGWIIGIAAILLLACVGIIWYVSAQPESSYIGEDGSIKIEQLSEVQAQNLQKLCKVWGFAKYHHPKAVYGEVDWDNELFKLLPEVLKTKNAAQTDKALFEWINAMGELAEGTAESAGEVRLAPDTAWIADEGYVTKELSEMLVKLSKTYISDRSKAYVSFNEYGFAEYQNEKEYDDMNYADDGYRLLGLFRYWNIVEYYYPYKAIIGEDWNKVLTRFLPKFVEGSDELSYKLAVMELTSQIHDSHVNVSDNNGTITNFWGQNKAPFRFLVAEGKVVITAKGEKYGAESSVQIGDVVLKIDGRDIFEVIEEKMKYRSFSSDDAIVGGLLYYLFRTPNESLTLTLERDGKQLEEKVACYSDFDLGGEATESHRLLDENIGYINPGALGPGEIDAIMEKLMDTKGIIIDLRNYPSDFILYSLSNYLLPKKEVFSMVTMENYAVPGEFAFVGNMEAGADNPDYYKGKVMILINECSQSQAEFSVMAFRLAPNAQVIGSRSIGADGDIVAFMLPGGIQTMFSGIGIYNPDGSETQRVGLTPDVIVNPTIQGIREGRDELMEKAIELI